MVLIRKNNFCPISQNKKRRKTTRHTMYSVMSSIPSGGPPGGTHTQELWYSLRDIDARLESVLSTDKCLCDACCARFSTPNFVVFVLVFWTDENFLKAKKTDFEGEKTHVSQKKQKKVLNERGKSSHIYSYYEYKKE